MALVRIVTGSESFASGTSGLLVHVPNGRNQLTPASKPIFVSEAAKQRVAGITQPAGRSVFIAAARTGIQEQGSWFDGNFDVPDGTVLRVFGRRQERVGGRNGHPMPLQRGVVFIRIRHDAALRRLTLTTISDPQSSDPNVAVEGRFDVLSLKEAGAAGIALTAEDLALTKVAAVQGVISHQSLDGERAAPKGVTREKVQIDGEDVTVETARNRRAINLGD